METRSEGEGTTAYRNQQDYFTTAALLRVAPRSLRFLAVSWLLGSSLFVGAQPVIVQNPESEEVVAGQVVKISVAAQGDKPLRYHWQFNGRKLPIPGRTLRFVATRRRAGTYQAIVRDARGNVSLSEPATLAVQPRTPPVGGQPRPVIVVQPSNVTVHEHDTATFQVLLNDSGPYTTIVWHNDNPLEGPHEIPDGIGLNVHSPRLVIPNCLNADNFNGLYWIAVTNASGGTVSTKARLTVVTP
jgi:hypothetical protein